MIVRSRKTETIALTRAEDDPGADILTEEVLVEGGRDKRWGIDSSVVRTSVAYIPALDRVASAIPSTFREDVRVYRLSSDIERVSIPSDVCTPLKHLMRPQMIRRLDRPGTRDRWRGVITVRMCTDCPWDDYT